MTHMSFLSFFFYPAYLKKISILLIAVQKKLKITMFDS